MSIEAMKQALASLKIHGAPVPDVHDSITALRTAIEQAEKQEPVAVVSVNTLAKMFQYTAADPTQWQHHWAKGWNDAIRQAMDYTTPPAAPVQEPKQMNGKQPPASWNTPAAQRQWVEVEQVKLEGDKLIAKLREKNDR